MSLNQEGMSSPAETGEPQQSWLSLSRGRELPPFVPKAVCCYHSTGTLPWRVHQDFGKQAETEQGELCRHDHREPEHLGATHQGGDTSEAP